MIPIWHRLILFLLLEQFIIPPDLFSFLESTFSATTSGGSYFCWITTKQSPLRQVTDNHFREYFQLLSDSHQINHELAQLSSLFHALSDVLSPHTITLDDDIPSLGISKGKHNLQQLLYDYIFKCYYNSSESPRRNVNQLFDWFMPKYYHETSSADLDAYLNSLSSIYDFDIPLRVSKDNGHFFILRRS